MKTAPSIIPRNNSFKKMVLLSIIIVMILIAGAMMNLFYQMQAGMHPPVIAKKDCSAIKPDMFLEPGVHFVHKFPFMILVPADRSCYVNSHMFYYVPKYYYSTKIPHGHIGITTDCQGRTMKLSPGVYYLNRLAVDILVKEEDWEGPKLFEPIPPGRYPLDKNLYDVKESENA